MFDVFFSCTSIQKRILCKSACQHRPNSEHMFHTKHQYLGIIMQMRSSIWKRAQHLKAKSTLDLRMHGQFQINLSVGTFFKFGRNFFFSIRMSYIKKVQQQNLPHQKSPVQQLYIELEYRSSTKLVSAYLFLKKFEHYNQLLNINQAK